jgi:hypothetical protein
MTSVMYETPADLQREQATIERFLAHFPGCTAEKLPRNTHADFAILSPKGKRVLYVEVKQRFCSRRRYSTYWIGKSRLERLARSALRDGVTPLLLVEWEDALGFVDPNKALKASKISIGGRTDRNDERDIEPMASFPFHLFTFFKD